MWPFLCDGDRVILETVTGSALSIGDVVLFDDAERGLMLHRLVRRGHDGAGLGRFQTRSDALLRLDQPFGPDRLLARVACIEGKSRRGRDLTRRLEKMRAWATVGKGLMMSYLHYKVGWPGPHRISGHAMPGRRFPARVAARVADLSGSTE